MSALSLEENKKRWVTLCISNGGQNAKNEQYA